MIADGAWQVGYWALKVTLRAANTSYRLETRRHPHGRCARVCRAGRSLKGSIPADLPVEQSTRSLSEVGQSTFHKELVNLPINHQKHGGWKRQPQGFGGFLIHHQLKPGWLLNR